MIAKAECNSYAQVYQKTKICDLQNQNSKYYDHKKGSEKLQDIVFEDLMSKSMKRKVEYKNEKVSEIKDGIKCIILVISKESQFYM